MYNPEDNEMIENFAKNLDKAQLARQIQNYVKGKGDGMFMQKKTEMEYKQDIINLLKERKKNGL